MAYISKEEVQEIRERLKKTFPGIKFGLRRVRYSCIELTIKSSPFFAGTTYKLVSIYSPERVYTGEELTFLRQVNDICCSKQTQFETSDYGTQPSYYVFVYIGNTNKPHICTAKQTA
jgi:hypothetical protein